MSTTATIDLAAELNQQIALISDSEEKMQAALNYMRRLVRRETKEERTARIQQEFLADFKEALTEVKMRINGELPHNNIRDVLNEL